MSQHRKALGAWGENVAVQYLQENGYTILARNWKTKLGELDIVAQNRATIVCVEVKTRAASRYGHYPEESVTREKQRTLRQLAELFLRATHQPSARYRIDVIAIMLKDSGPPEIHHIQDAVQGY